MRIPVFIVIYLFSYAIAVDVCLFARDLRGTIQKNNIKGALISAKIMEKYKKCADETKVQKILVFGLVGAVVGLVAAPIIAPLFAAKCLFGAAAVSSGLAALGGGSLAAGGFGMLGGQIVVGFVGSIIGSQISNLNTDECWKSANEDPAIHFDVLYQDENTKLYEGYFYYNLPHGQGKLFYNDRLIYEGKFILGLPEKC